MVTMKKYIQKVQKTNTKIYKYHTSYNKYYLTNSAIVVIQYFLLSLLLYPHFTFLFWSNLSCKYKVNKNKITKVINKVSTILLL